MVTLEQHMIVKVLEIGPWVCDSVYGITTWHAVTLPMDSQGPRQRSQVVLLPAVSHILRQQWCML